MRQLFLDTETTGLDPRLGHRIIEIACVEMLNRRLTQRHLHFYLNPDRDIDEGALAVHGISREFLADKPRFGDIVNELIDFINGAELIIHNAPFDTSFLDNELHMLGLDPLQKFCAAISDTLKMARELHPGKKNNLNALCERYAVDNSRRTLHGALLDAEILADVYLAMTRGQESLVMDLPTPNSTISEENIQSRYRPTPILFPTAEELAEHERVLHNIQTESSNQCLWLNQPDKH